MKIAIIGAGNMGGATAWGLLKSKSAKAADIRVADLSAAKLEPFAKAGVTTFSVNSEAVKKADVVMVFVKPWLVETVLSGIKDTLDYKNQILVVVAAGVASADVNKWLKKTSSPAVPALFLAIPNIAIAQLCSMTFLVPVKADKKEKDTVCGLFDAMGRTLVVEERLLPAGTTLASCGLAYAMRYVRAAAEGGVELGFYPDAAKDIVLQTVKGAVELLQADGNHPEAEIDKVTTPGGVTIRGLNEMEHAGFTSAVIRGLKAGL
jgi:pyrroline-5-carboxylate reductase